MNEPVWWERDSDEPARIVGGRPELVDATRESVRAGVRDRIPGYTPDWTNPDRQDAGVALVRLFGTQAEPVLARVNRLPDKLLAEHLRVVGVRRRPAGAAATQLEFTVTPPDGASVLVPAGFQAAATGPDGQVVFETERDLYATPARIAALAVQRAESVEPVPLGPAGPGRPFAPLGEEPVPGNALWIGLSGPASPYPALSLGFVVDAVPPAPASAGGLTPLPEPPAPALRWDVLDGGRVVAAEVLRDETAGLRASGTVELRVPRTWEPGTPPAGPVLRWLRLRFAHGSLARQAPVVTGLRLNLVPATAARTITDEPPQPIQDRTVSAARRMRLSQVPILAGSVVIEVDNDPVSDVFGTVTGPAARWREVATLSGFGPLDRVFVVDHATGELTFGDGVVGAAVPPGFRNVRAVRYRVGGGSAGAVNAGAVTSVITALPFVTRVTNPFPATGGTDPEPDPDAIRRGTAELRARGRAVAPADYGLLATEAPGALVARAHGVPGLHPGFPGRPVPGVVGVLVVPPPEGDAVPVPTADTLRAVADHLTRTVAPAGVTVVTAPAEFRSVAVEARVTLDPDRERAEVLTRAADALTTYLDPVRGGEEGAGWPFGGALRHTPLVRRLLTVDGVLAVSALVLTVDGLRLPPCADHALPPHALVWPLRPLLIPVEEGPRP
ncbi:putative baseplate assembly protein [Actinophytocola xinjiangensis]|uniref:Putative baseplate assembly protein n=1 Tax=Actinophytocola xinjiangensis TaxID=485602 RepID=A0A7Z0WPY8_9PSEU|nr:putative baseplate assembly protein [Actinophytocola xinjiangensis]OLF10188.1 putative baseplate assembly protein [Actinophytocola xinjiangensis]